jgi:hypothetical protein
LCVIEKEGFVDHGNIFGTDDEVGEDIASCYNNLPMGDNPDVVVKVEEMVEEDDHIISEGEKDDDANFLDPTKMVPIPCFIDTKVILDMKDHQQRSLLLCEGSSLTFFIICFCTFPYTLFFFAETMRANVKYMADLKKKLLSSKQGGVLKAD